MSISSYMQHKNQGWNRGSCHTLLSALITSHEQREQSCLLFLLLPHNVERSVLPRALAQLYRSTADVATCHICECLDMCIVQCVVSRKKRDSVCYRPKPNSTYLDKKTQSTESVLFLRIAITIQYRLLNWLYFISTKQEFN